MPQRTDVPTAFVARVEKMLKEGGMPASLERHACRLITNTDEPAVAFGVLKMLLNYKYGMPKQTVAGDKDNPIAVQIITNLDLPPLK
jgi:hypothetical protein